MKIKKLLLASALLFSAYNVSAQTQVIAHRGFWKTEGSAQNSIAALIKADSIGCYGSEFDVWLAADDQLVVNHDPTFKGKRMENSPSTALTAINMTFYLVTSHLSAYGVFFYRKHTSKSTTG